jgi:hypothetical protein
LTAFSHYAGLDISLKTTSIANFDQTGKIAFGLGSMLSA